MQNSPLRQAARRALRALCFRSESPATPGVSGQRRDLVTRTYAVRATTIDEHARSVETVMATEEPVRVFDWSRYELVIETLVMSGLRFPAQVPLLDSHNRNSIKDQLGSTRDIRVEGDKLVGRDFFSSVPDAVEAFTKIREGHVTDHSIGYRVLKYSTVERGKTAQIGSRSYTAPADSALRVTTEALVVENSVTPVGADVLAKVRTHPEPPAARPQQKETTVMTFELWLEKRGLKAAELNTLQREALRIDFEAWLKSQAAPDGGSQDPPASAPSRSAAPGPSTAPASAAPVDTRTPAQIAADAIRAERDRVSAVRAEAGTDVPADTVDSWLREGIAVEEARKRVLDVIRKRPAPAVPYIGVGAVECGRSQIEASLLLRAGGYDDLVVKQYGEQVAQQGHDFRWLSLRDIAMRCLALDGRNMPHNHDEMMREAFSTISLPIILGNVANKSLLLGYNQVPNTWRRWCTIGSVNDFKQVTRARMTDTGELEQVTPSGEIPSGSAVEEYERYNIDTWAKKFSVTRQNVIDDDLGVFTRTPQAHGAGAARRLAKLVYQTFMSSPNMGDSVALFHASSHLNLNTSAALGTAGKLSAAIAAFRKQVDASGEPIDVAPKFLLYPPELRETARGLLESDVIVAWGGTSSTEKPSKNINKAALEPIEEARLSTAGYTNQSSTTWYVTADPADGCDTVEVAFLRGVQTPTIERFTADPNYLGVIFRVYHDFGAKPMDWRTVQKNTA